MKNTYFLYIAEWKFRHIFDIYSVKMMIFELYIPCFDQYFKWHNFFLYVCSTCILTWLKIQCFEVFEICQRVRGGGAVDKVKVDHNFPVIFYCTFIRSWIEHMNIIQYKVWRIILRKNYNHCVIYERLINTLNSYIDDFSMCWTVSYLIIFNLSRTGFIRKLFLKEFLSIQ